MGAAAALSLLRTPQYTATASVVLDVKSPDPIAGVVLPGMTVVGYMATQLGIMQSERVALGALQAIGLDKDPAFQKRWHDATGGRGDLHAWLAEYILSKLDVVPARDANVITVSYTSPDPAFAAAVANAFVKAYIDTTLDLRVDPAKQYNSFFDVRGKQLREELEHAQARLSAYQQQKGIVANDEKVDVENQRLADLTSQLVLLQGVANESSGKQSQAASHAERMPEALVNPLVVSLNSDLAKQESRLNELATRLGDNHPDLAELRSNMAQLRARIAVETRRVADSLSVTNDVNQTRLSQLRAAVDEQRGKLLRLKGQRDEAAVLQRDVENAQRSYDAVLSRASQTSVESQATQTNVSVLKRATPPPLPSSPRLKLNLIVAALVGGLLAFAAAIVREARDQRLRTDQDVLQGLKQPLMGVLPAKRAPARRNSSWRRRWTTHFTAALPHPNPR